MKILTQNKKGFRGFHGEVGKETKLFDSFGQRLYVGDVVILLHDDNYKSRNLSEHEIYGIDFVCEENTEIANWTNTNRQYVMGIANAWTEQLFDGLSFESEYWEELKEQADGWVVIRVKNHYELVENEKIGNLWVQTVDMEANQK
jgi:hypothetical protein